MTLPNSCNTMFQTLLFEDTSQLVCSNSWMFYTSVFQNTLELFSFFLMFQTALQLQPPTSCP